MTAREKEARLDRAVELIVDMLARAQQRGVDPARIARVHHSAAALCWFKGRGRSAALRAGVAVLRSGTWRS